MTKLKLTLCLSLVFWGGLFGGFQTKADIDVPIVAAPEMRECPKAVITDLGLWDDALRFENLDIVLLRRQATLFTYSLVTGDFKKIHTMPKMIDSRLVDGMTWKNRQWVFCQSKTVMPFAVDLSNANTVNFEIPGVKMPASHGPTMEAFINPEFGPGTIVAINGAGVADWPRDGNRPLYYWMNLESGGVVKFPTGWDLSCLSADQRRAVFENIPTNAWTDRPWVTVDMATGKVVVDLPDQTKGMWSEAYHRDQPNPFHRFDYRRHVWDLRSSRTPAKLLNHQPGRGYIDDKFAGLCIDGTEYPLTVPDIHQYECRDAMTEGNLAIFQIGWEGSTGNSLWAARLSRNVPPWLLATNCSFEMLGGQRCALLVYNGLPATVPQALVYDAESNTAWDVLDGVPSRSGIPAPVGGAEGHGTAGWIATSETGPMVPSRMIPGFGSKDYAAKVLCLCSTEHDFADNVIPPPVQTMRIMLTAQGRRYQINFPPGTRHWCWDHSWLHNSGKLIVCQYDNDLMNRKPFHVYVTDLRVGE